MKKYKVGEILKLLKENGWFLSYTKGDHRQFKHPTLSGKVTVRGKPSETLSQELLNSIWKQAGVEIITSPLNKKQYGKS